MTANNKNALSVLLIGATGGTGREIMKQLYNHPYSPRVHAFCRDPAKLAGCNTYHTIVKGDARDTKDLARALQETKADVVIVSVGNGHSVAKSDIRTANAVALAQALKKPQFKAVRVIVVSSQGAGTSEMKIGMGIGKLMSYHLRHVLSDHTGQEQAFSSVKDRTFIVRPTGLTDDKPAAKIVEFGDKVKCPSIQTDRSDVAGYVVGKMYSDDLSGVVNITGMKK